MSDVSDNESCGQRSDCGGKLSSSEGRHCLVCDDSRESKKDGCCRCDFGQSHQCDKNKDGCCRCEKICCKAEEWSSSPNSCITERCAAGKQFDPCSLEILSTNDCCGSNPIKEGCGLTNSCDSRKGETSESPRGSPLKKPCVEKDVRNPDAPCSPKAPVVVYYEQICEAITRIETYTKRTPCERSEILSKELGLDLYFKKDFLQTTGSFKDRGTFNALLKLSEDERKRGVIAASAGNYALSLAHGCSTLNIPVTVVMPTNVAYEKVQKCEDLKACVVLHGDDFGEAKRYALKLGHEQRMLYLNGYDHPDILAGQGTMGCEIVQQVPDVNAVVASIGGGGMIAGLSTALKNLKHDVEIYGVEAEKSTGFKSAMDAGRPVMTPVSRSIAEGLSVPEVGANALATAQQHITELVTVKEDSIVAAMLLLLEKEKIVVEGAGAAGLAAIIEGKLPQLKGKKVVVVLCGANIDTPVLGRVIEKGLRLQSKSMSFDVVLPDSPGALATFTSRVDELGASIKSMKYERDWVNNDVFSGKVTCDVETRGKDHVTKFEEVMRSHYPKCHFCHE